MLKLLALLETGETMDWAVQLEAGTELGSKVAVQDPGPGGDVCSALLWV